LGGGRWNEDTCLVAARFGRLNILKHLRLHSCPWDARTVFCATEYGHYNIVEWALQNGCPCDKYALLVYAVQYGRIYIVELLLNHYYCYTPTALEVAYLSGNNYIFDMLAAHVIRHF